MQTHNLPMLTATVQRLLRRDATANVAKILCRCHSAEIAAVMRALSPPQVKQAFDLLESNEQKGEVMAELAPEVRERLLGVLSDDELVPLLREMSPDDAVELLEDVEEDRAQRLLERLSPDGEGEAAELLEHAEDTAGRIMIPNFFAVAPTATVGEATERLKHSDEELEMAFYLYVVNEAEQLCGVVSLRQLVTSPDGLLIKDVMTTEVVRVQTDTDQEEVARLVARYNILAIPVVTATNQLVGIVTVDDVIDVIREEATEDFLKMAGAGDDLVESASVGRATRTRLPWLFASWMGGLAASAIIAAYEADLSRTIALAAFMPVILGMSGNIGTQSSTIVVRGLATGRIELGELWRVVAKESLVGLLLGLIYGVLLGIYTVLFYGEVSHLWAVVSLSIMAAMTVAAFAGTFIPMTFKRLNVDPAVATGPFVTTTLDMVATLVYFSVARVFISMG